MKRFIFRLETLLKHRETLEDLREQEFAVAQGRHDAARQQLDALLTHYRQTVAERPGAETGSRFNAPAIQSREKYIEALQQQIAQQTEHIELARLIAEEMRVEMVAAKQKREAVSQLRDKDHADYVAEVQRKTQEGLDEIASMRFARQQSNEQA